MVPEVMLSSIDKRKSFILVIDPGHGGYDSGAVGLQSKEKDIALAVSLLTGKYISQCCPDVEVIYTRDSDKFVNLYERVDIANKLKADLFISIHVNASQDVNIRGTEVYAFGSSKTHENSEVAIRENVVTCFEKSCDDSLDKYKFKKSESYVFDKYMMNRFIDQSIEFAIILQEKLKSCVTWLDRGVKQAEYIVLRKTRMPRVLVELDFITNPEAETYLLSENGQKKYALAILNAFKEYKVDYGDIDNTTIVGSNSIKKNTNNNSLLNFNMNDNKVLIKNVMKNKVYKIQIFASVTKLPENSSQFKGYKVDCYEENNLYKYTCDSSSDYNEILKIKENLLHIFDGAFIVCFKNGVKVHKG